MNDDELTRRIRDARPSTPRRGASLDNRAEAVLRSIVGDDAVVSSNSNHLAPVDITRFRQYLRPIYLSAAAAVAIILVAAVSLMTMTRESVAYAATPPPLAAQPISGSPREVLIRLSESVRMTDAAAKGGVRFQSWALMYSPEDEDLPVAIVPEVHELRHRADGTTRFEIRAGQPYDDGGNQVTLQTVQPGEVLWSQDFAAGEFMYLYPEPPALADEYGEFFQEHTLQGTQPTTGDYFHAVRLLLGEQALSSDQEAAMIEFLANLPDITVDGEVVDRLGREGVSISTDSRRPGQYSETLVISPEHGVLSYENTYIGNDRPELQAPAVVEYTAWQ